MANATTVLEAAINLLDSDEGVNAECYQFILGALPDNEVEAIRPLVEAVDGFYFLPSDSAYQLREQYGF